MVNGYHTITMVITFSGCEGGALAARCRETGRKRLRAVRKKPPDNLPVNPVEL